jgi:chromosome segregation ATPase
LHKETQPQKCHLFIPFLVSFFLLLFILDIALQNQEIESLQQEIKKLSARPTIMNQHVEELEQLVDQQSSTLAGLHDALSQRDALIGFFESEWGNKDKIITKLKEELANNDARVGELEESLKKANLNQVKGPNKNTAHLEAQIRDLEAERMRYRAEIKNYQVRVEQIEADQGRQGYHKGADEKENAVGLREEAAAVAAELTSLRVLVHQAGKDSSAFSALRESEIGGRDFACADSSLPASISTIRRETDALRSAVTAIYAESVGSECAVQ